MSDIDGAESVATLPERGRGGVFVSHVHDDKPLADAFALLLEDASAGALEVFSSSAHTSGAGIRYGAEWFQWITSSIERAEHVVALLTPASLEKPWILFEAGLGKAKPNGSVFGLAIGVGVGEASRGPFAVFQNSGLDDTQLLKMCRQLMAETSARPRDEMVFASIKRFKETVDSHIAASPTAEDDGSAKGPAADSAAIYQAIEDLKYLIEPAGRSQEDFERERWFVNVLSLLDDVGAHIPPAIRIGTLAGVAEGLGLAPLAVLLRETAGRAAHPQNWEALDYLLTRSVRTLRPWSQASEMFLQAVEGEIRAWGRRRRNTELRKARDVVIDPDDE